MSKATVAELRLAVVREAMTLMDRMQEHKQRRADEFNLPPSVASLIMLLSRGPLSMREIAQRLRVDNSYITALANQLEKRKLAVRATHPEDRRVKTISLTAEGHRVATQFWAQLLEDAPPIRGLREPELRELLAHLRTANGTRPA